MCGMWLVNAYSDWMLAHPTVAFSPHCKHYDLVLFLPCHVIVLTISHVLTHSVTCVQGKGAPVLLSGAMLAYAFTVALERAILMA